MQFEIEVVVRESGKVVRDALYHDGPEPARWSEADAAAILQSMLLAVDRAVRRGPNAARTVTLRGLSWIVSPFEDGVAIAIEIPSGSVIAGPFDIAEERLSELITRAILVGADL